MMKIKNKLGLNKNEIKNDIKYEFKNIFNTKNEFNNIFYDKRKLPLFKTPIILKKINDENKNLNYLKKLKKTYNLEKFSFKEIVTLFSKGIKLYNYNLNKFLLGKNKKDLILQLKNNHNYKLNKKIANYFYIVRRFFPFFERKSLIPNPLLFIPKGLFRIQPTFRFKHRLNSIIKVYNKNKVNNNKIQIETRKMDINNLKDEGAQIITEIDKKIMVKTNIINILKRKINLLKYINSLPKDDKDNLKNKDTQKLNLNTNLIECLDNVKKNRNHLLINENKLFNNKNINSLNINKTNEIKIVQTINSIFKNEEFNSKYEALSIKYNPVEMLYYNDKNKNFYKKNKYNNLINKRSILADNLQKKPIIHQYLKAISPFNMHQEGIVISYSNIIGFNFNTENNKLIKDIYKLLAGSFKAMYCLISKPVFVMTPDKIIIQLFYFLFIPNILKFKKLFNFGNRRKLKKKIWFKRKRLIKKQYRKFRKIKINVRIKLRKLSNVVITKVFKLKFKKLCQILSHLFNKPVHLDLIRLHYPYNDSNILVNLLGIMINKIKLRIIFRKLFEKAVIKSLEKVKFTDRNNFKFLPAFLSGLKIRVAGRLLTHRVIPRKTVKSIQRGATAPGRINLSDVARYTNKNKRGSFSITVSSGQNFFN